MCLRSWKDHLVTAHLGKWMKEQNVVTAGHSVFALKEQVSVLENRVLSRLQTGCFVVFMILHGGEKRRNPTRAQSTIMLMLKRQMTFCFLFMLLRNSLKNDRTNL